MVWHRGPPGRSARESEPVGSLDRIAAAAESHGVSGWVLRRRWRPAWTSRPAPARRLPQWPGTCARSATSAVQRGSRRDGIEFSVAKGPALNAVVHRDQGCAPTLTSTSQWTARYFADALEALEAGGLVLLDRNWTLLRAAEAQELRLRTASGGWSTCTARSGEGRQARTPPPSVKALWNRGRHFDGPHGPVRTLGSADTLRPPRHARR